MIAKYLYFPVAFKVLLVQRWCSGVPWMIITRAFEQPNPCSANVWTAPKRIVLAWKRKVVNCRNRKCSALLEDSESSDCNWNAEQDKAMQPTPEKCRGSARDWPLGPKDSQFERNTIWWSVEDILWFKGHNREPISKKIWIKIETTRLEIGTLWQCKDFFCHFLFEL